MTFIISNKGVKNTKGIIAKFGSGGSVNINGEFENTGEVEVDINACLNIAGNTINSGKFSIKDYNTLKLLELLEGAANSLEGEAKEYVVSTIENIKNEDISSAETSFKKFFKYFKKHPELVTSSVLILLQLFCK